MYGLGDTIFELNKEIGRLKRRKSRLLSDNRKLRKQVKKLEEELVAAKRRLELFVEEHPEIRDRYEQGGW